MNTGEGQQASPCQRTYFKALGNKHVVWGFGGDIAKEDNVQVSQKKNCFGVHRDIFKSVIYFIFLYTYTFQSDFLKWYYFLSLNISIIFVLQKELQKPREVGWLPLRPHIHLGEEWAPRTQVSGISLHFNTWPPPTYNQQIFTGHLFHRRHVPKSEESLKFSWQSSQKNPSRVFGAEWKSGSSSLH